MIRLEAAIEIGPTQLEHAGVSGTQPLEHDDPLFIAGIDGEFDVGQHPRRVGMGHQQRA